MCDASHQNMPYSCLYWEDLYFIIFVQRTDFNVRVSNWFYKQNDMKWLQLYWKKIHYASHTFMAIHLHPVLVLSPMLNAGCGLGGWILHLRKCSSYWEKNDHCYNNFCISEHHNIYPAEFASHVTRIHFNSAIPQDSCSPSSPLRDLFLKSTSPCTSWPGLNHQGMVQYFY